MFWIILIIVLAAVIIPAAQVSKENQNLKEQYKLLSTQYQALQKQCASLEKYKKYAKYSKIADAEATAAFILQQAHSEATLIISDAQTEARKIAGEAIDARDNAILYKKTSTDMKNIISGYGSGTSFLLRLSSTTSPTLTVTPKQAKTIRLSALASETW